MGPLIGLYAEPYEPIISVLYGGLFFAITIGCYIGPYQPIIIAMHGGLHIAFIMGCYGWQD
jgi:hypothetical protein